MKAKFTIAGVNQYVQSQIESYEDKVIEALQYQGNEFVDDAIDNRTFGDAAIFVSPKIGVWKISNC